MKTFIPGIVFAVLGIWIMMSSSRDSRAAVEWGYSILGIRLDQEKYRAALVVGGLIFVVAGVWTLHVKDVRVLFGVLLTLFGAFATAFGRQFAHAAVESQHKLLGAKFNEKLFFPPFLAGGLIFIAWGILMLLRIISFNAAP